MMGAMDWFKVIIVVQLFYAFAITLTAYAIPADAKPYVTGFSDVAESISLDDVASQVQESVEAQTNIPVVELGALVFFSGNIVIDLLLNFFFAIPQMLGMLVNGIMLLFSVDSYVFAVVQLFATTVVTVLYFVALLQLLVSVRSGQRIT